MPRVDTAALMQARLEFARTGAVWQMDPGAPSSHPCRSAAFPHAQDHCATPVCPHHAHNPDLAVAGAGPRPASRLAFCAQPSSSEQAQLQSGSLTECRAAVCGPAAPTGSILRGSARRQFRASLAGQEGRKEMQMRPEQGAGPLSKFRWCQNEQQCHDCCRHACY